MKILNSQPVSSFGGINFVLDTFDKLRLGKFLTGHLPELPTQSKYSWRDILYSYWSVFFCGGDCAEDLTINLKSAFDSHPTLNLPSPDRVLERIKSLSKPSQELKAPRGKAIHQFSTNTELNKVNLKLLKKLSLIKRQGNVLDYDNTFLFNNKADAANTYKKRYGYCPGVGIIGNNVVYVENRNGNSNPETLQKETLERMFKVLKTNKIKIGAFRADAASYMLSTIATIESHAEKFYVRARVSDTFAELLDEVEEWSETKVGDRTLYRASISFTPFTKIAKRTDQEHLLKEYRLVITKEPREDGQVNMFTGEAFDYRSILTNDYEMSDNEVVFFYNQRGTVEREFDILKNDFGWNNMPFSKLEQNTVFLVVTAMCRNLYSYIINKFSKKYQYLKPSDRIKKFIFRFICIPAKWIMTGRTYKLRLYGGLAFKT
jgi:hypothetical protein